MPTEYLSRLIGPKMIHSHCIPANWVANSANPIAIGENGVLLFFSTAHMTTVMQSAKVRNIS